MRNASGMTENLTLTPPWASRAKRRIIMQLVLQPKEQEVLVWALQSTVLDLGSEIAGTEKQEFREDLKERKAVLLGILSRLG
jgi:hypothetical protein